ncbi:MAG: acyltransferase family protein [Lachnospiraceae bacterium]|nr:acyltransferase family protein [Lachnospiraceae bacterium]
MRNKSLDKIRIIAITLVVLVHTSAQWVSAGDLHHVYATEFSNIISFVGVGIFAMLSGALMLSPAKKMTAGRACKKAFHFLFLYFFWKGFYLCFDRLMAGGLNASDIKPLMLSLIRERGYYHLWYLAMLFWIILLVPLIRQGCEDKKTCMMYLIPFALLSVILPAAAYFDYPFRYTVSDFVNTLDPLYYVGYLGFFILGHYLYEWNTGWNRSKKFTVAAAAAVTFAAFWLNAVKRSIGQGKFFTDFSTPFNPGCVLICIAVFICIADKAGKAGAASKEISLSERLSRGAFGVYMLHPLVLVFLTRRNVVDTLLPNAWGIPVLLLMILIISYVISMILNLIPGIKKLLG